MVGYSTLLPAAIFLALSQFIRAGVIVSPVSPAAVISTTSAPLENVPAPIAPIGISQAWSSSWSSPPVVPLPSSSTANAIVPATPSGVVAPASSPAIPATISNPVSGGAAVNSASPIPVKPTPKAASGNAIVNSASPAPVVSTPKAVSGNAIVNSASPVLVESTPRANSGKAQATPANQTPGKSTPRASQNSHKISPTPAAHTASPHEASPTPVQPQSSSTINWDYGVPTESMITSFATPSSYPSAARNASLDIAYCDSTTETIFLNYHILIPNWQSTFDFDTANNDLRGSLEGQFRCAGYLGYQAFPVGEYGTTLAATFQVATICTNYRMTGVISATTGGAQNTGCYPQGDVPGDPDISNTVAEVFEDGDDGEDV